MKRKWHKKNFWQIIVLFLPFILFYWMLPFVSEIVPGRDFVITVWMQLSVLFAIKTGTFPLFFSSTYGGLQSSLLASCGLLYLPLPYIAAALPGFWHGQAVEWNLLLHLLTIAAAHGALFIFLQTLGISRLLSLFLSILTVYSQRILVLMFSGMMIQSWPGHIFLCSAIGLYYVKPTRFKGPIFITISTYWLINSGHPEEVLFAFLGAALFTLFLPYVLMTFTQPVCRDANAVFRFWGVTAVYSFIGVLLSAASFIPFYFDIAKTLAAAHQEYSWTLFQKITPLELINSFVSPFRTGSQRSFVTTSLCLMIFLIPVLKLIRVKIPKVIWVIYGTIILVLLYALGDVTPVHYLAWKHLPLFSSVRMPVRVFSILPMQFLFIFFWLFRSETNGLLKISGWHTCISGRTWLSVLTLLLFASLLLATKLVHETIELGWLESVNYRLIPKWAELATYLTTVLLLLAIAIHDKLPRFKEIIYCFLSIILFAHLMIVFQFSSPPLAVPKDVYPAPTLEMIKAQKKMNINSCLEDLYIDLVESFISQHALEHLRNYMFEPTLARLSSNVRYASNRQEAYKILNEDYGFKGVVIENFSLAAQSSIGIDNRELSGKVEMIYSSYNRLVFRVTSDHSAFFILSYPFSHNWKAWLGKQRAPIYRANAFAQAIIIPPGINTVEFRYWSWAAFGGMLISCLTLGLFVLVLSLKGMRRTQKYIIAPSGFIVGLFLLGIWYNSLYSGSNLQTTYSWDSASSVSNDFFQNIAYGKPTSISSKVSMDFLKRYEYIHDGKRVVDGDDSMGSCCLTQYQYMPWVEIDLIEQEEVANMKIKLKLLGYELNKFFWVRDDNIFIDRLSGKLVLNKKPVLFNNLPLVIAISSDKSEWRYATIDSIGDNSSVYITFATPQKFRYLKIMASGYCRLCLNEVEIYPSAAKQANARSHAPVMQ